MIERIDGDVDKLSNFFSQFIVNLLSNLLLLLGILTVFFTMNRLVGIAMSTFACVALSILIYLRRRAIPINVQNRQMSAEFYGFLGEQLAGTEDIRANGAAAYMVRRLSLLRRQWFPIQRRANMLFALMFSSTFILFACGTVLALMLGAYLSYFTWYCLCHALLYSASYHPSWATSGTITRSTASRSQHSTHRRDIANDFSSARRSWSSTAPGCTRRNVSEHHLRLYCS
jgi:ABC-type multidrug transport system fused ATPase/permease subunit